MMAAGLYECVTSLRDGNRVKVKECMPLHLLKDVELVAPDNESR